MLAPPVGTPWGSTPPGHLRPAPNLPGQPPALPEDPRRGGLGAWMPRLLLAGGGGGARIGDPSSIGALTTPGRQAAGRAWSWPGFFGTLKLC